MATHQRLGLRKKSPHPGCSFKRLELGPRGTRLCPHSAQGLGLERGTSSPAKEQDPALRFLPALWGEGRGGDGDQGPLGTRSHPILFHRLHIPF